MRVHSHPLINQTKNSTVKGCGLFNSVLNKLPFELHLPGYNFCGPGTKLQKRIERGDVGINPLDEACKEHDLAYSHFNDLKNRHKADSVLQKKAAERYRSSSAGFQEKIAALAVQGAMKAKTTLGLGLKHPTKKRCNTKKKTVRGKAISFLAAVREARKSIGGDKQLTLQKAAQRALQSIRKSGRKILPPRQRIIPVPKTGGFLPLIPLFAGLSALGALSGGAAAVANAVNQAKANRAKLDEEKRHNMSMEQKPVGKGLYMYPYKKGYGLYLKPFSKNS